MNIFSLSELGTTERIIVIVVIAVVAHLSVIAIRRLGQRLMTAETMLRWNKLRTLAGLITSALVFTLYFGALGFVLQEFGVSLTAYLASASILGLAIGFGSQGVVQDVVTGLTVILSDLFQVGDLIEISGQTGIVQSISMRFTILLNPLGAKVFIPNRTLSSVIIYPRGYVRCFADITLSDEEELADKMLSRVEIITASFVDEFPGIMRSRPELGAPEQTQSGRVFVRVKFRIWPGRHEPIKEAFKTEIVATLKLLNPDYNDWMVSINNEVSETPAAIEPFRSSQNRTR
ncbi:MAG: mechanosensitive ion channel family protein [Gammaproteobacteria bacterium]|nr:mechanosensitive ion channel family protein [Gammaproteobacteria bacterium]